MEKSKENLPSTSSADICDASTWIDDEKLKVRGFKVVFLGEEACVCVDFLNISTEFHLLTYNLPVIQTLSWHD